MSEKMLLREHLAVPNMHLLMQLLTIVNVDFFGKNGNWFSLRRGWGLSTCDLHDAALVSKTLEIL